MELINVGNKKILYHNNGRDLVNFRVITKVGSSSEREEYEYGAAHFLEHMFFKGSENLTAKEIKRVGAELGGLNAYTSEEKTVYYISMVKDNFKAGADLICEMLFRPLLPADEFEKERGVIQEEYQMYKDDPFWNFISVVEESFWGKRGHNIVGRKKSLEEMTIQRLMKFRNDYYRNENTYFGVVGGIDRDEVVKYFEALETSQNFMLPSEPIVLPESEGEYSDLVFHHESKQAIMSLSFDIISSVWEEKKGKAVDSAFRNGLGSGMHSLLFQRLREDLGYCYHVGADEMKYSDKKAFFAYIFLDKKNVDNAREEMINVLKGVKENGFPEELVNTVKKNIIYRLAKRVETSNSFASNVIDNYVDDPRYITFEEGKELIQSVTNDNIRDLANMSVNLDHLKFSKMTNEETYKAVEFD